MGRPVPGCGQELQRVFEIAQAKKGPMARRGLLEDDTRGAGVLKGNRRQSAAPVCGARREAAVACRARWICAQGPSDLWTQLARAQWGVCRHSAPLALPVNAHHRRVATRDFTL